MIEALTFLSFDYLNRLDAAGSGRGAEAALESFDHAMSARPPSGDLPSGYEALIFNYLDLSPSNIARLGSAAHSVLLERLPDVVGPPDLTSERVIRLYLNSQDPVHRFLVVSAVVASQRELRLSPNRGPHPLVMLADAIQKDDMLPQEAKRVLIAELADALLDLWLVARSATEEPIRQLTGLDRGTEDGIGAAVREVVLARATLLGGQYALDLRRILEPAGDQ